MKRTTYSGERLKEISFPLGGIGTGSIGLAGNGRLLDWEIFNAPNKGSDNGHTHFAVKTERAGEVIDARVLCGDVTKDYLGQYGKNFGFGVTNATMQGFPHFRDCTFSGEYPIADLSFDDPDFPGKASLTAFNPLIPHNAKDSGIPAAFFRFSVKNTTKEPLTYTFAATLRNPKNGSLNAVRQEGGICGIFLDSSENVPSGFDNCDMTIATDGEEVGAQAYWYRGSWFDGLQTYWRNFRTPGIPAPRVYEEPGKRDCATLYVRKEAAPGETVEVRFVMSWNSPNRRNYWDKYTGKNEAGEEIEIPMKNYYATVFPDSFASARYALTEWNRLYDATDRYRHALFSSTLPEEVIEAISATTSVLKTETCLRIGENGDFFGWEGLAERSGSCPGTCSHVWNYAYVMCFLFPELERNIRTNDYLYNQREDGDMCFRTRIPFGRGTGTFRACVDGQMGGIMKVYREWKLSGDDEWMKSVYDKMAASLRYAWSEKNLDRWDADHDGVLEGRQHHTLDMELFGPSSWLEGFYLGALHAASEMAEYLGREEDAKEFSDLFEKGKKWSNENLYNGKYFIQRVDLGDRSTLEQYATAGKAINGKGIIEGYWNDEVKEIKYQIGEGCEIDQLLAQWHADIIGLGDLFDRDKVDTALTNVFANNYKETMRHHTNSFRLFSVNDEAATVICDYPEGARVPAIPIPYAEETMHGFEYAFAGLLISRDHIEEGLRVVRAVRDRYDGAKRNPWNEIECGNNYARSMASYALLPIFSGMTFDLGKGELGFAPKIRTDDFRSVFAVGTAWGSVSLSQKQALLEIEDGKLSLRSLSFSPLPGADDGKLRVSVDGTEVAFTRDGNTVRFPEGITATKEIRIEKQ